MLGLTLLALAAAPPAGAPLDLGERAPALVLVTLPKGAAPHIPATDLERAADRALRAHTGLDARAPVQAGVDAERLARCDGPGRLACWLGAAREAPLTAILVVTALPVDDGRDRVVLTLIDTARARTCRREPSLGEREATEALEDCIWAGAARTRPRAVGRPELDDFFAARVQGELSPLLDRMGELRPYGRVELVSSTPDVELRVDGRLLGVIGVGPTTLTEVRAGRRVLDFTRPGFAPLRRPVRVVAGETATAAVSLLSLDPPPLVTPDEALLYAGAAATAAGLGLAVYAIVQSQRVDGHCLQTDPTAACGALGQPTFGLTTAPLPSADRDAVNPSGVPVPAVAAGVGLAGLGWVAGALLLEDDEGFPWVGLLTGLAAGAAGAAITVALDPR